MSYYGWKCGEFDRRLAELIGHAKEAGLNGLDVADSLADALAKLMEQMHAPPERVALIRAQIRGTAYIEPPNDDDIPF
jgi:hypothetical protein